MSAKMEQSSEVRFLFNKALNATAVVSAYYRIGNNATKYNLTEVSIDTSNRSVSGLVGSTTLPDSDAAFTMVVVVDGDEYPIALYQKHEEIDED